MPVTIQRDVNYFNNLTQKLIRARQTALRVGGQEVMNELKTYPKSTAANKPGRFSDKGRPIGYYERNRGYWSPRVNRSTLATFGHASKAKGVILGSATQRATGTVAGYKLTSHSEQLGKRWSMRLGADYVIIANSASYAKYVQGAQTQSNVMKNIGWETDAQAVQKIFRRGTFQEAFRRAAQLGG
jgi:hypothetical protein